jgi:hypothetical protein
VRQWILWTLKFKTNERLEGILYEETKHLGSVFLDPVMKLRPYQEKLSTEALGVLKESRDCLPCV